MDEHSPDVETKQENNAQYPDTQEHTGKSAVSTGDKAYAAACYLFLLCIIPLIYKRTNPFVMHHARQGLTLALWFIASWILGFIPVIGIIILFPSLLAIAVFAFAGLYQALRGETKRMPYLHHIVEKMPW